MTDNNITYAAQSDKCNGWTNYATWRINIEMWDGFEIESSSPLIAALRCYVASKLGDVVAIPDELCLKGDSHGR